LRSDDDPACRSMSLNDTPDPTVLPKALAIPLKALKALLGPVSGMLGAVLAAVVGVDKEPKAGWPNAETGFAPMLLVWPNTDPGVAGTGILGAGGCSPPKALTV
jgi:hypothetical protein